MAPHFSTLAWKIPWMEEPGRLQSMGSNFYAEYIVRNAGLDDAQAGIKIARRNINNLRYANDTTLMSESKEELRAS